MDQHCEHHVSGLQELMTGRRASPRQRPGLGVAVAEDCPQHGPENRPPLGHVPRPGWRRRRGRSTAAPLLSPAEAGRRAAHFVSRGLACRARSRAVAAQAA
jgi:hypothetical protein